MNRPKGAIMQRDLIRPDLAPVDDDRLLPAPDDDHVGEDDDDAAL